MIEKPIEDRKS